ncbi:hypothetical protein MTO96_046337, partial [Rhipicephalus appendiculatus]
MTWIFAGRWLILYRKRTGSEDSFIVGLDCIGLSALATLMVEWELREQSNAATLGAVHTRTSSATAVVNHNSPKEHPPASGAKRNVCCDMVKSVSPGWIPRHRQELCVQ